MTSFFSRKSSTDPPALFPSYIIPSPPFRRSSFSLLRSKSRTSSTGSTSSTSSAQSAVSASSQSSTSTAATSTSISPSPSTSNHLSHPSDISASNPFCTYGLAASLPAPYDDCPIEEPTDKYLHGHTSHIHCAKCLTQICLTNQIISKGFTGRHGRAYLVEGITQAQSDLAHIVHASTPKQRSSRLSHISPATPIGLHTLDPSNSRMQRSSHALRSSSGSISNITHLPNTFLSKAVSRTLVTGAHMVSDLCCAICGTLLGWKYVEATEDAQRYKVGRFILETKRVGISVDWENGEEDVFGATGDFAVDVDGLRNSLRTDENKTERKDVQSPHQHSGVGHRVEIDSDSEQEYLFHDAATSANSAIQNSTPTSIPKKRNIKFAPSTNLPPSFATKIDPMQEILEFDSADSDECEDLFSGVWSPVLAVRRRQRKSERFRKRAVQAQTKRGYGGNVEVDIGNNHIYMSSGSGRSSVESFVGG